VHATPAYRVVLTHSNLFIAAWRLVDMLTYCVSDFEVDVPVGRFNLAEFMALLHDRRVDMSPEARLEREREYQRRFKDRRREKNNLQRNSH